MKAEDIAAVILSLGVTAAMILPITPWAPRFSEGGLALYETIFMAVLVLLNGWFQRRD